MMPAIHTRPRRALAAALVVFACALAPTARADQSRMSGRVVDAETQQPVSGARIELSNASGGPGFFRARTGGDGEFAIEGIVAERYYNLTVDADGYSDFVLGGWRFPEAQRSVEVVVPLDRAGVLEVRVTRAGRTAVENARVTIRSEQAAAWWQGFRPPPAPLTTNSQGIARFEGLAAGYWTVVAEANGLLTREARRVTARRGETTPVPLEMTRPAGVSGGVKLADGTPVAGISVVARGPAEGVGTTDAQGSFAIGDLSPGKYRLEIQQEGFEPSRGPGAITLSEGEERSGIGLTVTPRPPQLSFVLQREVFGPEDPLKIGLRSFRIGEVEMSLFQIPNPRLLDPEHDFRDYAENADTTDLLRVRRWMHQTPDGPPFTWREEELKLEPELPAGVYLLSARSDSLERRTLFFVSDLGLLVKRSPGNLLVSAASLKTGVAIARVAVLTTGPPAPRRGPRRGLGWAEALAAARSRGDQTDADGLLTLGPPAASGPLRVIAVSERHGVAVAEAPLAPAAKRGGDQLFLYTERPIYRPGQTVFWKALARRAAGQGYALPDSLRTQLELSGPGGASVDVPATRLSASGSADGAIELPREVPLGEWTLEARAGKAVGRIGLAIEEYRKPEYQVEVAPDREVYVNGDEVRFQISASYFFGAPVFGAYVRYNLFESRLRQDEDWKAGHEEPAGYGRVLKTGEARTDLDGRLALVFTPERVAYDRRLTLEVEVVDAANRKVRGRGSAIMGRGLFTVRVHPQSPLVMAGEPVRIEVRTLDHTGKAVSAAVTVELDQDAWNPFERRYTRSSRPLASAEVTTDSLGRALLSLVPQPARSGNLSIRARAEDAQGNRITDRDRVWIYDAQVRRYAYRYPSIEAFADRDRYQPGDTARIVVNTEVGYAAVLATVEGREIEDHQMIHLFGNTGLVSVPIRADYAPNVYVSLHVRNGKQVLTRTLDLAVAGERHDLAIELAPDREQYGPGETGTVRVRTRGAGGAPVPAEVSVGVVDEAIYALRPDATPDPHEVFYGHRPNWVTTVVSFPTLYLGGADKGGRDQVRRDFRDVALWAPTVTTDDQGRAEVTVRYPDNLTTWRITSRGATSDTRVGEAVAKTRVTKDVVARLATPRFFVAGDRASLVSIVNNRTLGALTDVRESLRAAGAARLGGPASAVSSIPPNGESRRSWTVEIGRQDQAAPGALEASFVFRARSKADEDALETSTPVAPRAVTLRPHGAGVVAEASRTIPVTLPSDLVRTGSSLTLALSPSPAAMMLTAAEALLDYRWACTEQTANAVRAAAAAAGVLRSGGLEAPGWEQPKQRIEPFIVRLAALRNSEGAWGWWRECASDPYLTVLAIDALARAEAAGLSTEAGKQLLQSSAYQLPRLLDRVRTVDGEAYCLGHLTALRHLAKSKQRFPWLAGWMDPLALSVTSAGDRLGTAALALAAQAQAANGNLAEARALFALLEKRAVADGAGLHWPSDPGREWFGDEEENTAGALAAMVALAPHDERLPEILRWLAGRRRGAFWRSTRASAPVTIAIADYLREHPSETKPDYRLRVEWNGDRLLDRQVGAGDVLGGHDLTIEIPGAKLEPGDNRLVIERRGTGSVSYSWTARALVPSPGPPPEPSAALAVDRQYLHAELTRDRRGRPRYLTTEREAGEPFKIGDLVMVRLVLRASRRLDHLVIEDPRPAGFEVDAVLPQGAEWPWNTHAEARDRHAAFFLERLEPGETLIEYLIRPEMAGRFAALPTEASAMYDPDLEARSDEARVEVVEK